MDAPAINQQLKTILFCVLGLGLAILAGSYVGSADYRPLAIGMLIGLGLAVWFATGRFFWVIAIASSFLLGTFPILGGAFTPFQILMAIGVAKFLIEDVILGRKRLRIGNRVDALLIAGFMGVLTLHAVHDRFGMRFLGSSVWGGRNYVNVYVGLAAFFIIQSIPMEARHWKKLPYLVLAVASFDLFIAIITTIFPSSIYAIYPFYSAVSALGIEQIVFGESNVTGRVGAFGVFGFILVILILATTSLRDLFHPKYLFRLVCLTVGFVSVLFSGFRSALVNVMIGFLAAGFRDLKFRLVVLLPLVAVILFGFSLINTHVFRLPKQVQRALSFVPGDWDREMVRDARGSNEFRSRVWTLWAQEYFPRQPFLGRGFGFNAEMAKPSIYHKTATDYQQTVEVQNLHNGLFATLDSFGIIGTIFFVIWVARIFIRTLKVSFNKTDPTGVTLRFVALYLGVWIVAYWFGAQTVGSFLPLQFALAGVLIRLQEAARTAIPRSVSPEPHLPVGRSALAPA